MIPRTLNAHTPRVVIVTAAIVALAAFEGVSTRPADPGSPTSAPSRPDPITAKPEPSCPVDTLPDQGVCIPVPRDERIEPASPLQLELLPGRTEDYARYVTPLPSHVATSARGGPGIFIAATAGTPVRVINLEFQVGAARRITLPAPESRILTLHRTARNGATRAYLLSYEGVTLDPAAPDEGLEVGTRLGEVQARPGATGLGLSVRQLRQGVDPDRVSPERLLRDSHSLACDPRNVLLPSPPPR